MYLTLLYRIWFVDQYDLINSTMSFVINNRKIKTVAKKTHNQKVVRDFSSSFKLIRCVNFDVKHTRVYYIERWGIELFVADWMWVMGLAEETSKKWSS